MLVGGGGGEAAALTGAYLDAAGDKSPSQSETNNKYYNLFEIAVLEFRKNLATLLSDKLGACWKDSSIKLNKANQLDK